ncbi:MAG TPA: PKD domain-containing protein [Puia sp.]|nr:PKD domain-containing protein [Puia sp.]
MGRSSLFFLCFTLSVLFCSAQSGYSDLEFVENKGQWDTAIKFRALMSTGAFFLRNGGFSVLLNDTTDLRRIGKLVHGESIHPGGTPGGGTSGGSTGAKVAAASTSGKGTPGGGTGSGSGGGGSSGGATSPADWVLHSHMYHVSFVNANPHPQVVAEKVQPNYNNYLLGKDPSKWASNVKIYLSVTFKNLYDGIDIHYYANEGVLKYDLIVHPGADPSQIILQYDGQDQLSVQKNQLVVKTSVANVKELEPRSYQVDDKGRTMLPCNYVLKGNKVSFRVKSRTPGALLVIDPSEIFCTFTGSRSDNWGYTSTYDNGGNFYAGGIVLDEGEASGDLFGATSGAFQRSFQGGDGSEGESGGRLSIDVGIMKFNSTGKAVVYATYLGGEGDEQPHSMICDAQGNLIVTGRTTSTKFPTVPASNSQYASSGFDIFITKLNAAGSAPIGSVKIGGTGDDGVNFSPKYVNAGGIGTQQLRLNYGDDGRAEVMLDANNNIFVASCTQSTNFPTRGAFQSASGGGQDGVIVKFDPNITTLMASSYVGGSGADALFSVAISPLTNILYATGGTLSGDISGAGGPAAGSIGPSNHGGVDGLITMIQDNGTSLSLLAIRYFGTTTTDMIYGVQVDARGFPYIMGTTYGVIPIVNSPFNQGAGSAQASGKQFITKLQPDLSGIVYSANFGPAGVAFPNISPTAFLVDRCENVYVSGWGGGIDVGDKYNNSKTTGLTVTGGPIKALTDGEDFYFFVLQKNAASQLYGSFFGQPQGALGDHVDGGTSRFDKQGVIYQSICANCGGPANIFPVTTGVVFPRNGTGVNGCNEAAVKIAFNFAGVTAGLKVNLEGRGDSLGCAPLDVTFTDTVRRAKSYIWRFGDGTPDLATTSYTEAHTYTNVGIYRVMLIAIDSNSCNVADTVYHNITVKDNRANVDFSYQLSGPCGSFNYTFTNLSQPTGTALPFSDTAFTWIIDGTVIPRQAVTDLEHHTFPSAGTYNVNLILVDTNYCNAPDTLTRQLYIATNVVAIISTPDTGCAPGYIHFDNNSLGGQTYLWDFGDGSTSTDRTPPDHFYINPGQYTVKLHVTDPATCNVNADTSVTITLLPKPSGDFTTTPDPPTPNTPTSFFPTNSPDVVKWEWIFGDGSSEVKFTGDSAKHQYMKTDTFQACLVVFNSAGCSDTVCHPVATLINPLLDVPNAFTPGRFGQNSIIKVMGFGIVRMNFRIYNRWGQMVFQSINPDMGWDGTFRGNLQPMDVYAYTLEAEFSDGTHVTRKGDITLVR